MHTEKEEHWRRRLVELIDHLSVKQVEFADATGIGASYVSRLLYPPGKKGKKNLGVDTMAAIRQAYDLSAGWFDLPLGADLPSKMPSRSQANSGQGLRVAQVIAPFEVPRFKSEVTPKVWPFHEVKPQQYNLLSAEEKEHIEKDILIRVRGRDSPAKQITPAQNPTSA